MLEQLRRQIPQTVNRAVRNVSETVERMDGEPGGLTSLRMLAAELLLVTGVGATMDTLSRAREAQRDRIAGVSLGGETPLAAVWGPALLAPLAAAAHVKHGAAPSDHTARASRILDLAVIGLGVAELAGSLTGLQSRRRQPSLVPLALASAGLLGLAVDHRERALQREHRRLERRARVVERLVPQRRPKLDRIVVHV